jgi:hypothetical protein
MTGQLHPGLLDGRSDHAAGLLAMPNGRVRRRPTAALASDKPGNSDRPQHHILAAFTASGT